MTLDRQASRIARTSHPRARHANQRPIEDPQFKRESILVLRDLLFAFLDFHLISSGRPCFQFNSVWVFYLQVEENSTEDKSKDGAPLDSQSEGTNYFLQYISTPR